MEEEFLRDDSDEPNNSTLTQRLYDGVCEVFDISTRARDICRDGLVLMNGLYSHGYREPALLIRDWLQGTDNVKIAFAMVIAKAKGLHFAFELLLDASIRWVEHDKDTALHLAVRENNAEMTRLLVEIDRAKMEKLKKKGLTACGWLNEEDSKWITPLAIAAIEGYSDCLRALLEGGANMNLMSYPGFFFLLIKLGSKICTILRVQELNLFTRVEGYSPLEMAIVYGHSDCITQLLLAGVDLKGVDNSCLSFAALRNNATVMKLLLEAGMGPDKETLEVTPLQVAAAFGAFECVQLLVQAGFDVNARNDISASPLHLLVDVLFDDIPRQKTDMKSLSVASYAEDVAQSKQIECIRTMLEVGADINALDNNLDTPAHRAARSGVARALSVLINAGANVDALNLCGETILHASVQGRDVFEISFQLETMRVAIEAGVNLEQRSKDGVTALQLALELAKPHHLQLLIDAGADVDVLGPGGETPLLWLARNRRLRNLLPSITEKVKQCARALIKAGADISEINCQFLKYVLEEGEQANPPYFVSCLSLLNPLEISHLENV